MMDGSCVTRDTRHTGSCNTHFWLFSSLLIIFFYLELWRASNLNEFQFIQFESLKLAWDIKIYCYYKGLQHMVKFFKHFRLQCNI